MARKKSASDVYIDRIISIVDHVRVYDCDIGAQKTRKMIRKLAQPPQNRNGKGGKVRRPKDDSFYGS